MGANRRRRSFPSTGWPSEAGLAGAKGAARRSAREGLAVGLAIALVLNPHVGATAAGSPAATSPATPALLPDVEAASTTMVEADTAAKAELTGGLGKLPLYFIENRGQVDSRFEYYVSGSDASVYFGSEGVTYVLSERAEAESADADPGPSGVASRRHWSLELDFVDANEKVRLTAEERTDAVVSYFKGPRETWKPGVPTYRGVVYRELWPGIDLVYDGSAAHLKYTFVIQPGADPGRIQLAYRGATAVELTEGGRLRVSTPVRAFEEERPYAYQDANGRQAPVDARYELQGTSPSGGSRFGFGLGSYDRTKPLVLDPVQLVYSGYIGGSAIDQAHGIAVDAQGYAYVVGSTNSSAGAGFPATGGWNTMHAAGTDAFVAKIKADGTGLVYCGYIGGIGTDEGSAIAVDGAGNAYVTGSTSSTDFPEAGGLDNSLGGPWDAFAVKIRATGTSLEYSGYLGGSGADHGQGVAVDAAGAAHVVGSTTGPFPVSSSWPYTSHRGGVLDAFVAKINAAGTGFVYSGYMGGAGLDEATGVAVDLSGNAYVVGYTSSSAGFPVVGGPDLDYNGGSYDAFVAKIKADGTGLDYCGYIGGSGEDVGNGIVLDGPANAHVVGYTASPETSFPDRTGPDLTFNGGTDAFVATLDAAGTVVYCGYIGGTQDDFGNGIAVDGSGNAYVVGSTASSEWQGFPATVGPDLTFNGTYDAFVAKVKADGTALLYNGYLGGSAYDAGTGIAVDGSGGAYVAGRTASTQTQGFPVTVGPDLDFNGNTYDAFVAKIGAPTVVADLAITKSDGQTTGIPGTSITYVVRVSNPGAEPVAGVTVTDCVPATILDLTSSTTNGSYDSGSCTWTLDSPIPASGYAELTLGGKIDPAARDPLSNTATLQLPPAVTDPDITNNSATDADTLDPSADLRIEKTADLATVPLGELLTYTITVTNDGPSTATNATVSDALPLDMVLDLGPGALAPAGSCNFDAPTRKVTCSLGSILPNGSATVTIKVRPQALRRYVNTATVTCSETDPPGNNSSSSDATQVDVSSLGVRVLTATSTSQRNVLEWVNPTDVDYLRTQIVVNDSHFPANVGDGTSLYNDNKGGSGGRWKYVHDTGLSNGTTYYYGAFVHRASSPTVSPGRFVTGRPFEHTAGPVKWAFSTGTTALAPPTVGGTGLIATSNDHVVYAMERGTDDDHVGVDSGEWPESFRPVGLGGPVQQRSAVVPVAVETSVPGVHANPVMYLGAQDGKVYVVDATKGGPGLPKGPTQVGTMVQAAPAGIFRDFGGALDAVLVGTRHDTAPNAFVALDPYTLVEIDRFQNGGAGAGEIGIVNGMAAVDYSSPPRVYFTSHTRTPVGSTNTLWCFDLGESPVLTLRWARQLGDIDSSPVVRSGRVYVGSPLGGGTIYSIDALDGWNPDLDRTFLHENGQVRGFIFPHRGSKDIYFATDDYVWGVTDDPAAGMAAKFPRVSLGTGVRPSPVLFVPASQQVYVGGSNGWLFELDIPSSTQTSPPTVSPVMLGDGKASVGAPSFDWEHGLVHVGTVAGIFYAVETPLPVGGMCVADCAGQPDGMACSATAPSNCFCTCLNGACAGGC